MKRTGKRALRILTCCSVVLCIGTGMLWIRSYMTPASTIASVWGRDVLTFSYNGSVGAIWDPPGYFKGREWAFGKMTGPISTEHGYPPRIMGRFALAAGRSRGWVMVPWWLVNALFAAFPTLAVMIRMFLREYKRSRISKGLCPICSYDLRATPDRCPECGTVASGSASAQKEHAAPEGARR